MPWDTLVIVLTVVQSYFFYSRGQTSLLDPFYTENSSPGKESQPPSQVQFSERL